MKISPSLRVHKRGMQILFQGVRRLVYATTPRSERTPDDKMVRLFDPSNVEASETAKRLSHRAQGWRAISAAALGSVALHDATPMGLRLSQNLIPT